MIAASLFFLGLCILFVGLGIGGHLLRIADAFDAQNSHYGISDPDNARVEVA